MVPDSRESLFHERVSGMNKKRLVFAVLKPGDGLPKIFHCAGYVVNDVSELRTAWKGDARTAGCTLVDVYVMQRPEDNVAGCHAFDIGWVCQRHYGKDVLRHLAAIFGAGWVFHPNESADAERCVWVTDECIGKRVLIQTKDAGNMIEAMAAQGRNMAIVTLAKLIRQLAIDGHAARRAAKKAADEAAKTGRPPTPPVIDDRYPELHEAL